MSIIDDAIVKLQAHALALSTINVRGAPAYPTDDATILPLVITHITEGTVMADSATNARLLYTIAVDFHVSRISMRSAYTDVDKIIPEFSLRLAGDPTLGGTVDTIVFPFSFSVSGAMWNKQTTHMVSFKIPVKFMEAPTT